MNKLNKLTHKINIMKKNLFVSAMALCTLFFASCSQDETLSEVQDNGLITISVASPEASPLTKAVTTVEGYTLTCVLQMVDAEGQSISNVTTQEAQLEKAFQSDNVTFTFNKDEYPHATKALFWAEYRNNTNQSSVYDSDDLTNITYTTTSFDLTNANLMAAADAFCGSLDLETAQVSTAITLERPFAQINVAPSDASGFVSYKNMEVTYNTPSSFNVFDNTVDTATPQTVTYTNTGSFDANNTWFTTLVFAPTNQNSLGEGNDITIKLSGSTSSLADREMTLEGEKITTDSNMQMNVEFDPVSNDVTVEVGIDNEYDKPELKVGSYIYADGTFGTNAEKAIAIVYAMAEGKDDQSNYGEGKTPLAYAMAVSSVARTNLNSGSEKTFDAIPSLPVISEDVKAPWNENDYNGYKYTTDLLKVFTEASYNSPLFKAFDTWKTKNALTGTNLSGWYIPSSRQLLDLMGGTYGYDGTKTDAQVDEFTIPAVAQVDAVADAVAPFISAEATLSYFGNHSGASNIMTSYTRSNRFMAIQTGYTTDTNTETFNSFLGVTVKADAAAPFAIRPVLTIFEDAAAE